jgi:tetratricopeptide (TPR) repeat protein
MLQNSLKLALLIMFCSVVIVEAGPLDQLTQLQDLYEKTENELLAQEMDYDLLLQSRIEYDGIGGFFKKVLFQRKKYSGLKEAMEDCKTGIDSKWSEMRSAWEDIQKQTFEVGFAAEDSGDYETAIKYYEMVQPRTDRERFRIGVCHKLYGNYSEAISWFRKLNAGSDDVQFEIGSTYGLWEKHDEAVSAYSKVVSTFDGSDIEEKALLILENYEKSGSYDGLYRTIASAYKQKAFRLYSSDFDRAVGFYKISMEWVSREYDGSAARASSALVMTASSNLTQALTILDQQNQAAIEYYQRKLNDARYDFENARRSYDQAMRDGVREFEQSLNRARREKRVHAEAYNRYVQQGLSEDADRAQRQMIHFENQIKHLMLNRDSIIHDSADYERRRMNDAEDHYHRIMNNQAGIISDYVAPYRRDVKRSQEQLDQINGFHRAAYGDY